MKKILPYLFAAAFAFGCSNDDDKTVTIPTDPNEIIKLPCAHKQVLSLLTQGDVDNFSKSGYCSVLELKIGSTQTASNITDLSPLATLLNVEGNITITNNPELTNLKGLENIINAGGSIVVTDNDMLENIDALSGIKTVGEDLTIYRNDALINAGGLKNAVINNAYAGVYIAYNRNLVTLGLDNIKNVRELTITENDVLKNIAFKGLETVSDFEITNNNYVESFTGFDALQNVESLQIGSWNLISIAGLQGVAIKTLAIRNTTGFNDLTPLQGSASLRNIELTNNEGLTSLDGLNGITTISNLHIMYNPVLTSVSGLSSITTISPAGQNYGGITFAYNTVLTTLSGLENVVNFEGNVNVTHNEALTNFCAIQNIVDNGNYEGYLYNISENGYAPDFTVPGGCSMD